MIKFISMYSASMGIDGADEYLLVSNEDHSELTEYEAEVWAEDTYFYACQHTGGYFCSSATVVPTDYKNQFLVIIHHRYDC